MTKKILITGAGSGIGRDAAFELCRRGHSVIATTETEEQAESLKKEVEEKKLALEIFKLDITSVEDREKIIHHDIDVLINNAAIGETGSLAEVPMDRVRRNFEVNVFATIETTQVALRGMMKKDKGAILFISSLAGRLPFDFLNPYSMTKAALSSGAAALRKELYRVTKNVHITIIEPGMFATGFNQKMLATKYEWMNESSYFYKILESIRSEETARFAKHEQKTTASIVGKIVDACEADKPRLRYVAPWYQGFAVSVLRAFGI